MSKAVFVLRGELRLLWSSAIGLRVFWVHLALAAAAVFISWPLGSRAANPGVPVTFRWWLSAEALILGYTILALGSRVIRPEEGLTALDWLELTDASPAAVVLGRGASLFATAGLLLLTSLPVGAAAASVVPVPWADLCRLFACFSLLCFAYAGLGTWIEAIVGSDGGRIFAADAAYVLMTIGTLAAGAALGGSPAPWLQDLLWLSNPLFLIARLGDLDPSAWRLSMLLSAGLALLGIFLAWRGIGSWRREAERGGGQDGAGRRVAS